MPNFCQTKPDTFRLGGGDIKSLKEDNSIIIKEADKGGASVIMNKEDYKTMAYYSKSNINPEKKLQLKYKKFLQKYKSHMTDKEFYYLQNFEAKLSDFYGLPKVHKSKQINEKGKLAESDYVEISENVLDLKLRPIVAGPSCQTHRLSNLVDILLRPYTKHVTSYLRDTTGFLNILPKTIPNDAILASFDVESLYSNIPHALGLKAVDYWLTKYPDILNSRFSKDFSLDGIQLILENNVFCFNNRFQTDKRNGYGY